MSEFEKWVNSLNLNEEKKLMPIAKMGWLAALKWALDNAVYIHSSHNLKASSKPLSFPGLSFGLRQ